MAHSCASKGKGTILREATTSLSDIREIQILQIRTVLRVVVFHVWSNIKHNLQMQNMKRGVLCYLISNQLIALGIFPTNKTHFGQKLWRGLTKTPRKIVPAALAGAGEQHFSEFSWLEAIGLGGARWSKLCQELVPAANLSTNTRLLSSWTWFKISCEGQLRESSSSSAGSPLVRN